MRPIELVMTAFGPYAGREVIDFRPLGDSALFLIHGPTGSGKTTILDAMCFALFGVTSGAERDGKAMRSDHVDTTQPTEIVFEFVVGSQHYRIRRTPEQELRKKRGEGTTIIPAAATLWRLILDEGQEQVMASGPKQVNETVEELLGFKYPQFRQVVMLPQGEFRRLLLADSKEREAILATLFQTEAYRRIEEALKQSAKAVQEAVRDAERRKEWLLQEAEAETAETLAERLRLDGERVQTLAGEVAAAREIMQGWQERYTAAKRLEDLFVEQATAAKVLAELVLAQPEMEERRARIEAGRKAAALSEAALLAAERTREAESAGERLAQAEQQLQQAKSEGVAAGERLSAQEGRGDERQEYQQRVLQLKQMRQALDRFEEAGRQLAQAQQKASQLDNKLADCRQRLTTGQEGLARLTEQRTGWQERAALLPVLEAAARDTELALKRRKELDRLRQEYKDCKQTHDAAQAEVAAARAKLEQLRGVAANLKLRWLQGQAVILANELKTGEPCPVCGSRSHPAVATAAEGHPSARDMEALDAQAAAQEKETDRKVRQLGELAVTLEGKRMHGQNLRDVLGQLAEIPFAELAAQAADAAEALAEGRLAAQKLQDSQEQYLQAEKEIKQLTSELDSVLEEHTTASTGLETGRAILQEREAAVPQPLRDPGRLEAELIAAVAKQEEAERTLAEAREAAAAAAERVAALGEAVNGYRAAAEQATAKMAEENASLEKRMRAAGFMNADAYKAACLEQQVLSELEQQLRQFENDLAVARDRSIRAETATKGLQSPDVATIAAGLEAARAESDRLVAHQAKLEEWVAKQRSWLGQLKLIENEIGAQEQVYRSVGRLAEVANGQNPLRMSFQRFVLTTLLEDVIGAANIRLKKMTRGRYFLQRMIDPRHRGAAGGLDIEIEDNYTGVSRHVSTLSGGETFLASLALALGLADVVQSFAGGIYLDTIFVDEGFGTLDPESLDMALQALVELQTRGRLVGIISHVPELRERIDVRLEIVTNEQGSSARWCGVVGRQGA